MASLKRLAAERELKKSAFYRSFLDNIRIWGRVQETDLMLRYFLAMRDPLLPLGFTSLGLKMLAKGKIHPPGSSHKGRLKALFDKARELEAQP